VASAQKLTLSRKTLFRNNVAIVRSRTRKAGNRRSPYVRPFFGIIDDTYPGQAGRVKCKVQISKYKVGTASSIGFCINLHFNTLHFALVAAFWPHYAPLE
jgi:hypothetical protein